MIVKIREILNPPYSPRDIFLILGALVILVAIPLTVIAIFQARSPFPQAKIPVKITRFEQFKKETFATLTLNHKLKKAKDKTKVKSDLLNTVKGRRKTAEALIEENPGQFLRIALSPTLRKSIIDEGEVNIEQPVTLEGEMEVQIAEDFNNQTAQYFYFLNSAGKRYSLHFADRSEPEVLTGSKVKVLGVAVGNKIAMEKSSGKHFQVISQKVLPTATVRKVAVILFNFQNDTSQPATVDKVRRMVFTATLNDPENQTGSVNAFYQENSFSYLKLQGKNRTDGDIYGWYTISYDNEPCAYSTWGSAASQIAASKDGFDSASYQHIIYAFPDTSQQPNGCKFGGWAQIGGSLSWSNGWFSMVLFTHELGHNLGERHSNRYECVDQNAKRVSISTSCTSREYGDPIDIMGSGSYPGAAHMNNYHKGRQGWFEPANTLTVTASGTYTLLPLENASNGVQALRIPKDSSNYYYLEYRQPIGFDGKDQIKPVGCGPIDENRISKTYNVVWVRLAPGYSVGTKSNVIDTTPYSHDLLSCDASDAGLPVDKTFQDSSANITVKTISINSTSATVEVTLGGTPTCTRANPTVSISPLGQWGQAGDTLPYSGTVTNNDSSACSSSTFTVVASLPSGLSASPASYNVSLSPGAGTTNTVNITSSSTMADGSYNFSYTATNSSATSYKGTASATYNVFTPDTTPPTASISSPTNGSTVSGTVTVSANATDNKAVEKVEFYIDGALKGTDTSSPYSYSWDTTTFANGSHSIYAKAYDTSANEATSATISVTVSNTTTPSDTTAPVVTISSPEDGTAVSGRVQISASATDNVAVASMELLIDNSVVATSTSSSISYTWNTRPKKYTAGLHTITTRAKDASGNNGSATISVTLTK